MNRNDSDKGRIFTRGGSVRRLFSAHDLAVLLLLLSAPVELQSGTVDYVELMDAGLVQLIETELVLTDEGRSVLNRLGAS